MRAFEIEIRTADKPLIIKVEEIDPWPDPEGFVRFAVCGDERRSVIAVDKSYWEMPFIMTEEDAWDYLEKVLYPEPGRVYSEDFVFTPEELEAIRLAIGKYLMSIKA